MVDLDSVKMPSGQPGAIWPFVKQDLQAAFLALLAAPHDDHLQSSPPCSEAMRACRLICEVSALRLSSLPWARVQRKGEEGRSLLGVEAARGGLGSGLELSRVLNAVAEGWSDPSRPPDIEERARAIETALAAALEEQGEREDKSKQGGACVLS